MDADVVKRERRAREKAEVQARMAKARVAELEAENARLRALVAVLMPDRWRNAFFKEPSE